MFLFRSFDPDKKDVFSRAQILGPRPCIHREATYPHVSIRWQSDYTHKTSPRKGNPHIPRMRPFKAVDPHIEHLW